MRTYSLHVRPAGASADGDAVLIREGFSWAAFLLSVPWALWHGLWRAAIVLIVAGAAIGVVVALFGLDAFSQTVVGLGYGLIVGLAAPDLRIDMAHLCRRMIVEMGQDRYMIEILRAVGGG